MSALLGMAFYAYWLGAIPAFLAGLLYGGAGKFFDWPAQLAYRLSVGYVCGVLAGEIFGLLVLPGFLSIGIDMMFSIPGAIAAMGCALFLKIPPRAPDQATVSKQAWRGPGIAAYVYIAFVMLLWAYHSATSARFSYAQMFLAGITLVPLISIALGLTRNYRWAWWTAVVYLLLSISVHARHWSFAFRGDATTSKILLAMAPALAAAALLIFLLVPRSRRACSIR